MSNANLEARVASLETYVAQEQQRLEKSLAMTFWTFVTLVVIVAGYTLYVTPMLQSMTGEDAILEYAKGALNAIPSQREALLRNYDDNADQWADQVVTKLIEQVDGLEVQAKALISSQADAVAEKIQKEVAPTFADALKEHTVELKEKHKDLSDPAMGQAVVDIFLEVIEEDLQDYLNTHFVAKVNDLQMNLENLARPKGEVTRKQDAERRFLQYWVHLADTLEVGDSPFKGLLEAIKVKFEIGDKDLALEGAEQPDASLTEEIDKVEGVGDVHELPKMKK
jgi:hypothetical protein